MKPILIVHGYSAESRSDDTAAIRASYGAFPSLLRERLGADVQELDLSRYVSLEDGLTIEDISRAMDTVLRREYPHLLSGGFNVIVHSTGALVVRNWMRRYWDGKGPCPIERVVHLAGANFGSGWAHVGRTQVAKWFREVFQKAERGIEVLKALELGSNWTITMHRELDKKIADAKAGDRPLEFCLIGSQRPDEFSLIPVKYATEEASDGVVRVPAGNLNYRYLKIAPKQEVVEMEASAVRNLAKRGIESTSASIRRTTLVTDDKAGSEHYEVVETFESRKVPFAVVFRCSHTYKRSSILGGEFPRGQVLDLIEAAFETDAGSYGATAATFKASHVETLANVRQMKDGRYLLATIPRRPQYNKYAQVVFRIFDQDNAPVKHFNIYFNSFGGDDTKPPTIINSYFRDGHPNQANPNTITFFIQRMVWDSKVGDWVDVIDQLHGIDLEIDALEHGNSLVNYLPLRYRLDSSTLKEWLTADQTVVIDAHLYRMPDDKVFKIVSDR